MRFFAVVLLAFSMSAMATDSVDISSDFSRLVRPDLRSGERTGSAETFISDLKKSGVVNQGAEWQQDFSDYYVVKMKTIFLGFSVAAIMHEYWQKDVRGCCVDPGITLILEVSKPTKAVNHFAEINGCAFIDNHNLSEYPFGEKLKSFSGKKLGELQCNQTYLKLKLIDR